MSEYFRQVMMLPLTGQRGVQGSRATIIIKINSL